MDGTSQNKKTHGALFRPVSLSQALDQFTPLIYEMVNRKARIISNSSADGIYSVLIYGRESRFWVLRVEDYDKCLSITRKFTYPLAFDRVPSILLDQIRSCILVEFAERQ